VPTNNWASALASNYSPPLEDLLLAQTGDITIFMGWFCKRRGINELKPQDLEGPAFEIVKVFHPDSKWYQINFGLKRSASMTLLKCMVSLTGGSKDNDSTLIDTHLKVIAVRTHMRILSVVRIEVFSMYRYDYMKKIVLRRADLNEHVIVERDFKKDVDQSKAFMFAIQKQLKTRRIFRNLESFVGGRVRDED
nr:hypothetical protein [Tanacetum cinerariifolium]